MTKFRINLTLNERDELTSLIKKGKRKVQHIQYAQILLGSDESIVNTALSANTLSERFLISTKTVERVRKRFCEKGMDVFEVTSCSTRSDKKFDARVESHLLAIACQSPPDEEPYWKLQLISDRLVELKVVDSISKSSVCNLLKKMNRGDGRLNPFKKSNM